MKPPDRCEPLEKLVDKLNEQLDALCSQSQEHLFLEGLIDLRGLTEATRAMLKDAEGRLANCRRHPVPPSNRPFLVTFTDSNCSRGIAEAHQGQARTPFWQRVVGYAGLGVLGLSLGYALHEHRVTQSLAAQNEQELVSLNATRSQIDNLTATVKALDTRPELRLAPVANTTNAHRTASPRQHTLQRRVRQAQWQFDAQGKAIEDTRRNMSATHGDLTSARGELTGSIARTHDELALSQRDGEHNYYEFDIGKSKQFQKDGQLKPAYSQSELASMSNANIPTTTGANQVSTNADAQLRLDRDHALLGFQRHYWFWKARIAHETHRISLATVPIRKALRRQISAK